jgi:lipid-A-disaccharide synthase
LQLKVYIIAGEPSGDLLASGLMRALLRLVPDVEFRGVGGESMTAVGTDGLASETPPKAFSLGATSPRAAGRRFESLFDISEISVMGFFEVLPRLPLILKRIDQTIKDIEAFAPDVLVTVDSWGFVSALLSKMRKRRSQVPVVHYVAPQVWAWKKGRARNVAKLVDRLMTLLPNEGAWFEKWGLQSDFVGHPVVERVSQAALDSDGFRAANNIPADATVISVLPGSRHSEAKRLIPILKESVERVAQELNAKKIGGGIFVVVPTVAGVEAEVRRGFSDFSLPVRVVTSEINRYNAFAISKLALAKSGTVSLELVSFGVPHLIAYTFSGWTNFVAKLLVNVRFANLINLLTNREIIPEFVLDRCRPELIAECATQLLRSPELAEKQVIEARQVMQKLRLPDVLPSDRAAQIVIEMAGRK